MRLSKLFRHHTPAITCLLLALASAPAMAQTDPTLAEAQRLLRSGQHAQALSKADSYIASKPKEPQGRFTKGLILAEMKRHNDAIIVFKKLTEDFPELPEPYNNLAVIYAQEKQYDKARQALEAAIKTHPAYAVAHENLGDVYAKLASQAYGKALQIDANNPAAQSKLSLIKDLASTPTGTATMRPGAPPPEPVKIAAADPVKPTQILTPPPVVATPPKPPLATPPVVTAPAQQAATAVVAKPTPVVTPTPPAPAPAAVKPDDVSKVVQHWASSWSRKEVKAYLALYAPEFVPPGGISRKTWEEERTARITKPGAIEVKVENIVVSLQGNDKATVKFRQHYKSANLKSSAGKTLLMVLSNGRWLIKEERVN